MSTTNTIQITRQRSHCRRDRHLIIVEHNDQPALQMTCLVYRFHRHATGKRCVSNQRDDVMILAFTVTRDSHSQSSGERRRGVACSKGVVFGFVSPEETADAAILFDGWE